jgi:hypothetical protein
VDAAQLAKYPYLNGGLDIPQAAPGDFHFNDFIKE